MIKELLKDFDPRLLSITLAAIIVLLSFAMIVYGIKPQYDTLVDNKQSLELLQTRMDDQRQLQQMIAQQQRDIETLQHELNGESGNLPINEMESYLIGRLQNLCWEADIQLISVRPGNNKRVIDFDEISFEVSVLGEYKKLYQWLNKLSENLGFVMVSQHKISTARQRDNNNLNMDMTIVFYRVAT